MPDAGPSSPQPLKCARCSRAIRDQDRVAFSHAELIHERCGLVLSTETRIAETRKAIARTREVIEKSLRVLRGRRLLILHEDQEIADRVALLAASLGCETATAPDGPTGMTAAGNREMDVIIISLTLRENAFELARELRAKAHPRHIRLVALARVRSSPSPGDPFDALLMAPVEVDALRTALGLERRRPEG